MRIHFPNLQKDFTKIAHKFEKMTKHCNNESTMKNDFVCLRFDYHEIAKRYKSLASLEEFHDIEREVTNYISL